MPKVKTKQMNAEIKKWEVMERLKAIDRSLYWNGRISRVELIKRFNISPQQGSTDLKRYIEMVGEGVVVFDSSNKCYRPTYDFKPIYFTPSTEDFIAWQSNEKDLVTRVPIPNRSADNDILRKISVAIYEKRALNIIYTSLNNPEGRERIISPHTLVLTNSRYHIRAYCHSETDFRDFVLGRIVQAELTDIEARNKYDDEDWLTLVIVKLKPHPGLSEAQKKVIERDFDMKNGEVILKVEQAFLLYFLDHFNLDGKEESRPAKVQQVVLANREILQLLNNR